LIQSPKNPKSQKHWGYSWSGFKGVEIMRKNLPNCNENGCNENGNANANGKKSIMRAKSLYYYTHYL
jgi:hypothetical protein